MNDLKINVIDGIMGSGKSTAMINTIRKRKQDYPVDKFLIIVPYLNEVERYASQLKGFCKLVKDSPPKRLTLENYLKNNKDIICTQQLFLQNPDLIMTYARNYNLVIDEALNSLISTSNFPEFINSNKLNSDIEINTNNKLHLKENAQTYTFTETDIDFLFNNNYLKYSSTHDNLIVWNNDNIETNSIYNCLKDYFTKNDVYRLETNISKNNRYYYISLFPINVFNSFKNIYVMTYIWNAQIMKYYFDFHNAKYTYFYPIEAHPIQGKSNNSAVLEKKEYFLSDNFHFYENVENPIKNKTMHNIYIPGYKIKEEKIIKDTTSRTTLYNFWNKTTYSTLSYSFYNSINEKDDIITILQNNIKKFCKDGIPKELKTNKEIIWSVFDCAKDKLKVNCAYINNKNYIPINAKATNEYKNANILIYLVNRFINPLLYNFIKNYCSTGIDFSLDLYSLSELVQWIWRSTIRDNKPICIYIASERMLNILLDWLNDKTDNIHKNINSHDISNLSNTDNLSTNAINTIYNDSNDNVIYCINDNSSCNLIDNNLSVNSNSYDIDNRSISYHVLEEKVKQKCIDEILKYVVINSYKADEVRDLLTCNLEELHDNYSYQTILNTIKFQGENLLLAKFNHKNDSSTEKLIQDIFKIININIEESK